MMNEKRGANVGVLIAIFNLWLNLGCLAENNIGCLFNQSVCEEEGEQCYNDNAFGRCLRKFEEPNSEDLYRHDLDSKALRSLEREMQLLFALGYRWSHIYTQCVLQAMLESFRYQTEYGDSVCDTLIDQDLEVALKVIEEDGQEVDPDSVAYVKFTPSAANPHAEFADEVYFPPLVDDEIDPNLVVGLRVRDVDKGAEDYQFPESLITKKSYTEQYQRNIPMDAESLLLGRLLGAPQVFNTYYNTPDEFRAGIETRDVDGEDQYEQAEDTEQKVTLNHHLNFLKEPRMGDGDDHQTPPQSSRHHGTPVGSRTGDGNDRITSQSGPHYNTPDGFRAGQETREEGRGDNERVDLTFSQDYNTPDRFRQGQESRDDVVFLDQDLREELLRFAGDDDNEIPGNLREFPVKERFTEGFQDQGSSRIKVPARHLSPEVQQLASMFHDSKNTYQHQPSKGTGYTEGGLVFLPEHRNSATEPGSMSSRAEQVVLQDVLDDGLDELLGEYDAVDAGFKRRERLDVKKPGPQFSTNNYAFHHDGEEKEDAATDKNGRRAQLNMPRPTSRRNSGNEETVSNGHGDDDTKDNQQGNLDDFFCHEKQTPPALSKNSDLCFGNKFDLVDCLESLLPEEYLILTTDVDMIIIDGAAAANLDATPHESPEKKEVVFSAGVPTSTALRYDVVDTTYAYVAFKTSIYEWEKGSTIVKKVAELLKLPFKTFKNIRRIGDVCKVHLNKDPQELEQKKLWDVNTPGTHSFYAPYRLPLKLARKESPNCNISKKYLKYLRSSSEIIGGMAVIMSAVFRHNLLEISRVDIKEELQTQTGVEVTSAGIGDKEGTPEHVVLKCVHTQEVKRPIQLGKQGRLVGHILRDPVRRKLLDAIASEVSNKTDNTKRS
uniref:Protein-tyrosine phosphatase receptor IA-2 ectodomain domain-containing protein n=1 Tax=Timema monikensis TaxID=170555 RepID=A0A7R9HNP7_9NEOP|nr:unnamed protein product [Timema monikensis]